MSEKSNSSSVSSIRHSPLSYKTLHELIFKNSPGLIEHYGFYGERDDRDKVRSVLHLIRELKLIYPLDWYLEQIEDNLSEINDKPLLIYYRGSGDPNEKSSAGVSGTYSGGQYKRYNVYEMFLRLLMANTPVGPHSPPHSPDPWDGAPHRRGHSRHYSNFLHPATMKDFKNIVSVNQMVDNAYRLLTIFGKVELPCDVRPEITTQLDKIIEAAQKEIKKHPLFHSWVQVLTRAKDACFNGVIKSKLKTSSSSARHARERPMTVREIHEMMEHVVSAERRDEEYGLGSPYPPYLSPGKTQTEAEKRKEKNKYHVAQSFFKLFDRYSRYPFHAPLSPIIDITKRHIKEVTNPVQSYWDYGDPQGLYTRILDRIVATLPQSIGEAEKFHKPDYVYRLIHNVEEYVKMFDSLGFTPHCYMDGITFRNASNALQKARHIASSGQYLLLSEYLKAIQPILDMCLTKVALLLLSSKRNTNKTGGNLASGFIKGTKIPAVSYQRFRSPIVPGHYPYPSFEQDSILAHRERKEKTKK